MGVSLKGKEGRGKGGGERKVEGEGSNFCKRGPNER